MKRSEVNMSEKRLEGIALLLDETLSGKTILETLRAKDIPVKALHEFCERGMDDISLMERLGRNSALYFVTRDRDFRYKSDVTASLIQNGVGAFVLTAAGNKTGVQLTDIILSAWPAICRFIKKHQRPFVAKVMNDGAVYPHNK